MWVLVSPWLDRQYRLSKRGWLESPLMCGDHLWHEKWLESGLFQASTKQNEVFKRVRIGEAPFLSPCAGFTYCDCNKSSQMQQFKQHKHIPCPSGSWQSATSFTELKSGCLQGCFFCVSGAGSLPFLPWPDSLHSWASGSLPPLSQSRRETSTDLFFCRASLGAIVHYPSYHCLLLN